MTSAPYHPASNGLAERAVKSFKRGFERMGEGSLKTKLARFLLQYRNAPQGTTGQSPAELLMGRRLRSHLLSPVSKFVAKSTAKATLSKGTTRSTCTRTLY